jgi:hypothetical protein
MLGKSTVLYYRAAHVAIHFGSLGQARGPVAALLYYARDIPARHGWESIEHYLLEVALTHDIIDGVDASGFHAQQHFAFAYFG